MTNDLPFRREWREYGMIERGRGHANGWSHLRRTWTKTWSRRVGHGRSVSVNAIINQYLLFYYGFINKLTVYLLVI